MRHNKKHIRIIFLLSVIILILNDRFFKGYFRNEITGKLSDIAGLFAFPYFLSLLFPKNVKMNYLLTGLFFIFWKSALIQPIIDFFQSIGLGINRIVDYTDLYTLIILPVSYYYWYSKFNDVFVVRFSFKPIIVLLCSFAFIATSLPREYKTINLKSNLEVTIKEHKENIITKLKLGKIDDENYFYLFELSEYKTEIRTKLVLKEVKNGLVSVKLDSIIDSETRGGFLGVNENDSKTLDKFTPKDYEKLFLERVIVKLYQK